MALMTASPTRSGGKGLRYGGGSGRCSCRRPYIPSRPTKAGQIAEKEMGSFPCSARSEWVKPTTPCLVAT
jgi:hypothetical protein